MKVSVETTAAVLFFLAYLITGLIIYDDYGMSWDEEIQRIDNGYANYNAVFQNDRESLLSSVDKYHGAFFEIFLVGAEKALNLNDSREIYLMRHLLSFLLFFTGTVFFYFLLRGHFRDWKMALIGCAMLILSPRIFAESFYNTKDILFLSVFIIAVFFLFRFFRKQSIFNAVLLALVAAVLVNIRILGILLPCFLLMLVFQELLFSFYQKRQANLKIFPLLFFIVFFIGFAILFWPVMWQDPVFHFTEAFKEMSHFHWDGEVFFLGEYIKASHLPWFYLPVWLIISTPVFYILFFVIGIIALVKFFLKMPLLFLSQQRETIIFLCWFFIPLAAIIILNSVVYDGWRHVYFIYPSMVCIGLYGIKSIIGFSGKLKVKKMHQKVNRWILPGLIVAGIFINPIIFIVKAHPMQYVFFNTLVPDPHRLFDLDYWGLSYREGLEFILDKDTSETISYSGANLPAELNLRMLEERQQKRFRYTQHQEFAEFFADNFRWEETPPLGAEDTFSFLVNDIKVLSLYRLSGHSLSITSLKKFFNDNEKTYENWGKANVISIGNLAYSGNNVCLLDSVHEYSTTLDLKADSAILNNDRIFIRTSFWVYNTTSDANAGLVVTVDSVGTTVFWKSYDINTRPEKSNYWEKFYYDFKMPVVFSAGNILKVYIWNQRKKKFFIDDFEVELVEAKNE